jgi:hypothetical protein
LRVVQVACVTLLLVSAFARAEEPPGTIRGRIQAPGRPALVAFFDETTGPPPRPERYFRVPEYTATSDVEGRFTAHLPPGRYFVAAIVRKSGDPARLGPPLEGDRDYQLLDKTGAQVVVAVRSGSTHDVGAIEYSFVYTTPQVDGVTTIEGTVTGPDGKASPGIHVVAYRAPRVNGRPHFSSYVTGADGRYRLRVHPGGSFFVRARSRAEGGAPEAGEWIGVHGSEAPEAVEVQTGRTVSGCDLRVSAFPGRGPSTGRKATSP